MTDGSPAISLTTICSPSRDVVAREIEGDMVIVPLVAGIGDADDELYTLNETGKAIWKRLDGRRTIGDVARAIAVEFDVPVAQVEADVVGFAREMAELRFLSARN
ncbi:MAG: PqqD family protein [Deltaproteobacteria bacterium]